MDYAVRDRNPTLPRSRARRRIHFSAMAVSRQVEWIGRPGARLPERCFPNSDQRRARGLGEALTLDTLRMVYNTRSRPLPAPALSPVPGTAESRRHKLGNSLRHEFRHRCRDGTGLLRLHLICRRRHRDRNLVKHGFGDTLRAAHL